MKKIDIPVTKKRITGLVAEKFVEGMLRELMKVPSLERPALWRRFLLENPKEMRKIFIQIRSKRARIRKEIHAGVTKAIATTSRKYPELKGLLFFGSFAEAREDHARHFDLDVIPILSGSKTNILNPDAYEMLSKLIMKNTGVKLHGLEAFIKWENAFRQTLTGVNIGNIASAREEFKKLKESGFVNDRSSQVHFASYNYFGDKEYEARIRKIVD